MEKEIWLPIKGFERRFKISSHGRILSIGGKYGGERILTPHLSKMGYHETELRMMPLSRKVRVHTLVAENFIGDKPEGYRMSVNHIDGIKTNNYYKNLEWISNADNIRHAVRIGLLDLKGEKHPHAILNNTSVLRIRELKNIRSLEELSEMFGVHRNTIKDVVKNITWTHLLP